MPGLLSFPSFPTTVPTHPLLVVDFPQLLAGDASEEAKLWHAATHQGFW